jgi:hypothetical protein
LIDRGPNCRRIRSQRLDHDTAPRGAGNPDHVGGLHDGIRKVSDRGSNLIILFFGKTCIVNDKND